MEFSIQNLLTLQNIPGQPVKNKYLKLEEKIELRILDKN